MDGAVVMMQGRWGYGPGQVRCGAATAVEADAGEGR